MLCSLLTSVFAFVLVMLVCVGFMNIEEMCALLLMNALWKVDLSFDSMGLFVGSWSPYDLSLVVL